MKTTLYWTGQRLQQGIREIRWTAQLWWFNQEIDFLAWWWRLESQLPPKVSTPPRLTRHGSAPVMQPMLMGDDSCPI